MFVISRILAIFLVYAIIRLIGISAAFFSQPSHPFFFQITVSERYVGYVVVQFGVVGLAVAE